MEPETFRRLIMWAAAVSVVLGALIGAGWSLHHADPANIRDLRLSRWSLRIDLHAAAFALLIGIGLATAGAYYYGRPWPWSTATYDPGSEDPSDAIGAIAGVVAAGVGAFLLAENVVNRVRRRRREDSWAGGGHGRF